MRSAGEVVGAIVIIVGVLALLGTVGGDVGLAQSLRWLWPLLIVGFGLWLILAASQRRGRPGPAEWGGPAGAPSGGSQSAGAGPAAAGWPAWGAAAPQGPPAGWAMRHPGPAGVVREQRFIGEIEMAGPIQAGPMRVETFIGEIRLDLTRAMFPAGETAIHVSTGIGEVRVLLPADIPAAVRVSSLIGESEALGRSGGPFLGDAYAETEGFATAPTRIRLQAQTLIGEVAVRRARLAGSDASPDTPGAGFAPVSSPDAPAPPDAPVWTPLTPPAHDAPDREPPAS